MGGEPSLPKSCLMAHSTLANTAIALGTPGTPEAAGDIQQCGAQLRQRVVT